MMQKKKKNKKIKLIKKNISWNVYVDEYFHIYTLSEIEIESDINSCDSFDNIKERILSNQNSLEQLKIKIYEQDNKMDENYIKNYIEKHLKLFQHLRMLLRRKLLEIKKIV